MVGQFSNKYLGVSIAFVGPNPYSFVSGGNLYNSHILDSLQSVGIQVIFPQNNRFPKSVEKANLVLIDSIFLKDPNFKMIKTLNTTKWLLYHLPTFIQDSSCVPIDEIPEEINRLKLFDKILVSSSSFIKYCHAIYPPEIIRKMVPILPGRNFELTEMPKREKKGTISRILSIGTICKRKGQKRLVEALAQIREQDWKLILIGNTSRHPQEVKEIKQLMKKHNLKISIRRNVSEVEKVKELQSADIFALPTCFETFGIALQEAMEFGLPIVTGNHMILRDWIGQNNAIFVDPLSPVEIQQGLRLLLEDSTLRTKLGQAAFRKVLDQNNWDETQESFLQLLGKEGLT